MNGLCAFFDFFTHYTANFSHVVPADLETTWCRWTRSLLSRRACSIVQIVDRTYQTNSMIFFQNNFFFLCFCGNLMIIMLLCVCLCASVRVCLLFMCVCVLGLCACACVYVCMYVCVCLPRMCMCIALLTVYVLLSPD